MSSTMPIVQALLHPQAYPEEAASVELVETHISYLFFTPDHVYKVKKPVNYGFLDFTTLERYIGVCLSQAAFDELVAYSQAFMAVKEDLFRRHEAEGRVRDCHGDLHTAQIFLENGISIIDCIEFNQRFRYSDMARTWTSTDGMTWPTFW